MEIASECSGLAQRGGLGSVIWGLSDAFLKMGHRATIVLPYYSEIRQTVHLSTTLQVNYGGESATVSVFETSHSGIRALLIHSDRFFRGEYSDVYIDSSKLQRGYFEDDAKRFAFFCAAACELLLYLKNREPIDTIHCHDWHTGLIPLLLEVHPKFATLKTIPRLFTIHNLEYQGTRPFAAWGGGELKAFLDWFPELQSISLDAMTDYLDPHADIPCINPMRAALNSANLVTTVSPSYAEEICLPDDPEQHFFGGRGLEHDLARLKAAGKLVGITNGIDSDYYDPQNLPEPYTHLDRESGQKKNRAALFADLPGIIDTLLEKQALIAGTERALRDKIKNLNRKSFLERPLLVAVTRLTGQKIQQFFEIHAGQTVLDTIAALGVHLLFLGKGDLLSKLQEATASSANVLLFGGFDDELEKRLYAAGDFMLMPSEFEPCGTSQMKAMRYGCLPIAASVGGLKDTIRNEYNGFLYAGASRAEKATNFLQTIQHALTIFEHDRQKFLQMQKNAMQTEFSWSAAAKNYLKLVSQ